jgi:1,4-dihydroxy-2-naphthoate octaprenyltransferase
VTVRSRPSLLALTLAAFVLGSGLLVAFEKAVTLAAGVVLLLAFVVLGVFTIASPNYLDSGAQESELPQSGPED